MNFLLAYDTLLNCSEYGSTLTLHKILKFVYLHSTNSLSVQYINSKHESRLVMNYDLQAIYSKYRTETSLASSALAP